MSPLLLLLISLISLLIVGLWLFSQFFRRHMQGEKAPQRRAIVTILDKQIIEISHPLPDQENQEYWIYTEST